MSEVKLNAEKNQTIIEQEQILADAVAQVLAFAQAKGVQADVIASAGESFSLKADQGELSEYKVTASQVIGIRVVKDEHVAISYSESLDSHQLEQMVDSAITNASYTKKDPLQKIRAKGLRIETDHSEIYQTDLTPPEQKIELALRLESEICAKPMVKSAPYNGYNESSHQFILANTLDTYCTHKSRSFSCYTTALLDHNNKQVMGMKVNVGRTFVDLLNTNLIDDAYQMAVDLLDGTPITTKHYSVIFEPTCLEQVFGAFSSCLSGESAKRGTNPWREKLNKNVANPLFTLSDIAYVKQGHAIQAFDSEGFETGDTPLIQGGKLIGLLHNSTTAAHFGLPHTANAGRSAHSTLGITSRHQVISTSSSSHAEITAGEYLELVDLQGVHSGADAISGDFSFGASGFLCRDGKRIQAVRGITVAGNFYTMLNEIQAIGDTLLPTYGKRFFTPLIRFEKLNIAGK